MASGYLTQNLQPHTIKPTWLPIMEADRARRLDQHQAQADRMAEYQKNMFSSIKNPDLEGSFQQASISAMDKARRHKVELYNQMRAGTLSETDYMIKSAAIDNLPLSIKAAQDVHTNKLVALMDGDEKLNFKDRTRMAREVADLEIDYDPESISFNLGIDTFDDKGNLAGKRKLSVGEYSSEIGSINAWDKQGVPTETAIKLGTDFKADKTRNASGKTVQGMDVGDSQANFDSRFMATFGTLDNPTNMMVMKEIVAEDPTMDTYKEAYDHLYKMALGAAREGRQELAPTPRVTTEKKDKTSIESVFEKNKVAVLSETGKGSKTLTTITPMGSEESVTGRGMTFDVAGTDKTVDVTVGDIEGVGKEGKTDRVKVENIFVSDDGEVYIKGSTSLASPIERAMAGESVPDEDWVSEGKKTKSLDWVKIGGTSLDRLRTTIMGGKDIPTVLDFLKEKSVGIDEEVKEEEKALTAQELIAKYSK